MHWNASISLFPVLSVVPIVASRCYLKRRPPETDHPNLNRRGSWHIGQDLILDVALSGGREHLKVDDTIWRVESPDLPAGAKVRVTAVYGATLKIEAGPD